MSKPIAIAFSDLHAHQWPNVKKVEDRLLVPLHCLSMIAREARKYKVPILFAGDWGHTPNGWQTRTLNRLMGTFEQEVNRNNIPFLGISGNHDFCERNRTDFKSPSLLDSFNIAFDYFNKLDWGIWMNNDIVVYGIPYIDNNLGFVESVKYAAKSVNTSRLTNKRTKILLIHTDLPGATDASGRELQSYDNIPKRISKIFKGFDLVLSGHIHKPQKLGSKLYMLGAPYQQTRGDRGCDMGYWLIYKDRKPKFVPIKNTPKFIDVSFGEKLFPNDLDYYNYLDKEAITEDKAKKLILTNKTNKDRAAKKYLNYKGIKSKKKRNYLLNILSKTDG